MDKCLRCKYEARVWIARTHIEKPGVGVCLPSLHVDKYIFYPFQKNKTKPSLVGSGKIVFFLQADTNLFSLDVIQFT